MELKKGHLTRDHGERVHNGCVRPPEKLSAPEIESGHSSVDPTRLTGPLVQLNISSWFSPMILPSFIAQRFSRSSNGSFMSLRATGWDQIVSLKVPKSSGSFKAAV